jgi:hypothetical protein
MKRRPVVRCIAMAVAVVTVGIHFLLRGILFLPNIANLRRPYGTAAISGVGYHFNDSEFASNAYKDHFRSRLDSLLSATNYTEIITWQGVGQMDHFLSSFWSGNYGCDVLRTSLGRSETKQGPILLNISFGCDDLFRQSHLGSGNFLTGLYGLRIAARALGNADLLITCPDAIDQKSQLLLPHVMGFFPEATHPVPAHDPSRRSVSVSKACSNANFSPMGYLLNEMQHEWRTMAIRMVGIPYPDHPSGAWARIHLWNTTTNDSTKYRSIRQLPVVESTDVPLYPSVELDESVIHFRCGGMSITPDSSTSRYSPTNYVPPKLRSLSLTLCFGRFNGKQSSRLWIHEVS